MYIYEYTSNHNNDFFSHTTTQNQPTKNSSGFASDAPSVTFTLPNTELLLSNTKFRNLFFPFFYGPSSQFPGVIMLFI